MIITTKSYIIIVKNNTTVQQLLLQGEIKLFFPYHRKELVKILFLLVQIISHATKKTTVQNSKSSERRFFIYFQKLVQNQFRNKVKILYVVSKKWNLIFYTCGCDNSIWNS